MDEILFLKELNSDRAELRPEATKWLEILNFPPSYQATTAASDTQPNALNEDKFSKFLARQSPFPTTSLENVTSGIRLLIQPEVRDPKAFFPGAIPFNREQYKSLVKEMRLPVEAIHGTSVVGPFFWWAYVEEPGNPSDSHLQIIFRKSDGQENETSRGWEMALSYSFLTRLTSGYVRGAAAQKTPEFKDTMEILPKCAQLACHPLLLPFLMLTREISSKIEIDQRNIREELREFERAVSNRYETKTGAGYAGTTLSIDSINRTLADRQCKVMWKSPQAWLKAVRRMKDAVDFFWEKLAFKEQLPELQSQHKSIIRRLEFTVVRLEGLESYGQVSLDRLSIQRDVMNSIISQRESRLSLAIAAQQRRIAHTTGRDSTSMKTLTLLGVMFLPGAFLSSLFGMSFFNFSDDIQNAVSPRIYIYFVIFVPVTIITLVLWFKFDQHYSVQSDTDVGDTEMMKLEERIMAAIRDRTGARVTTGLSENRPPQVALLPTPASLHANNNSTRDRGFFELLGRISAILLGKPPAASLPTAEWGGKPRNLGGPADIPLATRSGGAT